MDFDRKSRYETLYNIRISEFYSFATDVMADFGYSLHRTIKEENGRRRVESWIHGNKEDQKAVVWIEVTKSDEPLDPYLTTDVLRAMNDENVTRLFFFTNGDISADDRDILEGSNHFIFAREEIVETLIAIESKRTVKVVKKRKPVTVSSAMILIKNFFRNHEIKKKQIRLKTSAVPDILSQYGRLIRKILAEVDKVPDIDDISPDIRDRLKTIQFDLLPELARVPSYVFPRNFSNLRNMLFELLQISIIYVGNFIEYEPEDELKKNRERIEDMLAIIDRVDDQVLSFKSDMMFQAEKTSVKIILTSGAIMFASVVLLIVVQFSQR
jgi:hypothetical protein